MLPQWQSDRVKNRLSQTASQMLLNVLCQESGHVKTILQKIKYKLLSELLQLERFGKEIDPDPQNHTKDRLESRPAMKIIYVIRRTSVFVLFSNTPWNDLQEMVIQGPLGLEGSVFCGFWMSCILWSSTGCQLRELGVSTLQGSRVLNRDHPSNLIPHSIEPAVRSPQKMKFHLSSMIMVHYTGSC